MRADVSPPAAVPCMLFGRWGLVDCAIVLCIRRAVMYVYKNVS